METLVATSGLLNFDDYINSYSTLYSLQYVSQIKTLLSSSLTFKKISTSQIAAASSDGVIVVDGSSMSLPAGSLVNQALPNLTLNNVSGTVQEVQIYQGGTFQGSTVSGGTLLLDATLSSTQLAITSGSTELILTGSQIPTNVATVNAILQGTYTGANLGISGITLEQTGQPTTTLSFNASSLVLSSGDYRLNVTGTNLPASMSATLVDQLVLGESPTVPGSITGLTISQISTGTVLLNESALPTPISLATLFSGAQAFVHTAIAEATTIQSTASVVSAFIDTLESNAATHTLSAIQLTDGGTPTLSITAAQLAADTGVLQLISSVYSLTVTNITAATALADAATTHVGSFAILDSGVDIVAKLDGLESLASSGKLGSIALTNSGFAALSVTAAQLSTDATVLNAIAGNFVVNINAAPANLTISGFAGHGNTAVFSGTANQYAIAATGNGVSFTVTDSGTGRTSTDTLNNVNAVQFSNLTDIVAQTPGTSSVTSGNVTELYGAVFGRLPDVPGLAYYENDLAVNPGLPLTVFAQWFLASPEYVGNSAHNYAQTTAGDTQFITDSYTNLLHRAPEAGAVAWYEANVIAPFLVGQTPGSSAYTAALTLAHAYLITDFSASSEFLGDVTVTAKTPSSAQHWLVLI